MLGNREKRIIKEIELLTSIKQKINNYFTCEEYFKCESKNIFGCCDYYYYLETKNNKILLKRNIKYNELNLISVRDKLLENIDNFFLLGKDSDPEDN